MQKGVKSGHRGPKGYKVGKKAIGCPKWGQRVPIVFKVGGIYPAIGCPMVPNGIHRKPCGALEGSHTVLSVSNIMVHGDAYAAKKSLFYYLYCKY